MSGLPHMELLEIKKLNTAVERIMNQELAGMGVTYTQTTVIGYLFENSGRDVCQKDIEFSLGLTHPTVSSILSRMEDQGMICTEILASDHRYKKISLTDKALRIKEEIHAKFERVKAKLFDGVSPEQRAVMNAAVQAMLENARECYGKKSYGK